MNSLLENEDLKSTENRSSFLKIILFLFYSDAINKADKEWKKFSDDLLYKIRFSSDSNIIKALHDKANEATYVMPQGKELYRARIFNEDIMENFVKGFVLPKKETLRKPKNLPKLNLKLSQVLPMLLVADKNKGFAHIQESYQKWKSTKFKGYDNHQSGAPLAKFASAGRANPEHISYLYLCEDELTPIYEARPTIGQNISVAKFKTKKPLKIYDLTLTFLDTNPDFAHFVPSLYDTIGKKFSIPNTGDPIQYLPTQFIAEEIKNMNFDGLKFNSSLREGGVNVVLFDPKSCEALSSDIVTVESIKINTKISDVYNLENMSASMLDI